MVAARGGGGGDWDKMEKGSCYLMIIKEVKEYQVCKMKCFEDNCKTMWKQYNWIAHFKMVKMICMCILLQC